MAYEFIGFPHLTEERVIKRADERRKRQLLKRLFHKSKGGFNGEKNAAGNAIERDSAQAEGVEGQVQPKAEA